MRSKEAILDDIQGLPRAERDQWIELAKLEVLLDIRYNLDRINQTLIDICMHLESGVTVYVEKLGVKL